MSSPFSTIEEFEGAIDGATEGAIYTFYNSPVVNIIALLIGVVLFCWFIFKTFSTHYDLPGVDKSLNSLSVLLVAGLLSLTGAEYRQNRQSTQATEAIPQAVAYQQPTRTPLGLLGLVGIGLPSVRRTKGRYRQHLARNRKSFRL